MKLRFIFLTGLLVTALIFITNYKSNTYLIGWDNLQTELNPYLGVKRAFFGVWQEYQSFGLLSGLSHPADLIRASFISIISMVVPNHLVRLLFHLLMILVGFMGVVKFCQDFSYKKYISYTSFIAGLFYVLNFGTIQILGLPWEAFAIFFGFLPWEVWIFLKTLTELENRKRNLLLLIFINLLATPQSYVQTLFISYFMVLSALWLGIAIKKRSRDFFKVTAMIFSLILIVNLFWLLPQIYFLKDSSHIVTEAKANVLSTDDLKYINDDKGDLFSFINLQGFYYELRDQNQIFIFDSWKKHFQFPINIISYLLFLISFLGIFYIPRYKASFLIAWLVIAFALLTTTPPFSLLHTFLRQNTIISQIFRSPFTKFIIPNVFFLSFFFFLGINALLEKLPKTKKIRILFFSLIVFLILINNFPAFTGNFFAKITKVTIPNEYFSLFNFFKSQDKNQRIALLPDSTYWGWFVNNWGYNGSGFLWYGIEQPVVSRNFDVWSDKSEGYYWEIKRAFEAEDARVLEKVFDKYAIDFLIYDKSLMPVAQSIKAIQYDRIDSLLKEIKGVTLVKNWNYLNVYKINREKLTKDFIWSANFLPNIGPAIKFTNQDTAFLNHGDYQFNPNNAFNAYYPFLDFFTQTQIFSHKWRLEELNSQWRVSRPLPINLQEFEVYSEKEGKGISTYKDNSAIEFSYPLSLNTNSGAIEIQFPKIKVSDFNLENAEVLNCGYGFENVDKINEGEGTTLIAKKGAAGCLSFKDSTLEQENGYIIKISSENKEGQKLFFYVLDSTKDQSYLEDRLVNNTSYYILPPKYQYGVGYEFNFHNNSYEKKPTINTLKDLSIFFIPYNQLKQTVFVNKNYPPKSKFFESGFFVKKHTYFLYEASSKGNYIVLDQAFHPGWYAFGAGDHIVINNWANGWKIKPDRRQIFIIFLPQLLEFLGFAILGLTSYYLFGKGKRNI